MKLVVSGNDNDTGAGAVLSLEPDVSMAVTLLYAEGVGVVSMAEAEIELAEGTDFNVVSATKDDWLVTDGLTTSAMLEPITPDPRVATEPPRVERGAPVFAYMGIC